MGQGVKTEPSEPTIPRKRPSVAAFGDVASHADYRSTSSLKKLKSEPSLKVPLGQVNPNAQAPKGVTPQASLESLEDVREKLLDVQQKISASQTALDRLTRKKRPTKGDQTRISRLRRELAQLVSLKLQYNTSIPNAQPGKKPQSKHIASSSSSAAPVIKREPSGTVVPAWPHEVTHRDKKPKLEPTPHPMASGSKFHTRPRASSASSGFSSDDLCLDEDGDYVDRGDFLADNVLRQIGPIIPEVARLETQHDENGDFHGRGRDLFVGPQAKADE